MSRGKPFVELSPTDQDSVLIDVETGRPPARRWLHRQLGAVLRDGAEPHPAGHVRRSVLRRQRELRRLGSPRLPRRAHDGDRRRAAGAREATSSSRITSRRTTTRCSPRPRRRSGRTEARTMATRLKDTDVVIIGWRRGRRRRAAARAGGHRSGRPRSRHLADAPRLRARRDAQQLPRLADGVQKANQEVPTVRATASSPTPRGGTSDDERRRRHTLHYWAQSWRLNPWDFKVVSETKRRYGASRIPKGSTVEDWPFGFDELEPYYDKVEYEVGVSGQAGNINGKIDPRGNPFEGAAQARLPDAAAALDRVPRARWPGPRGRSAGIRFPGPRRSTRVPIRTAPAACITASATAAAATWTRRTRRR